MAQAARQFINIPSCNPNAVLTAATNNNDGVCGPSPLSAVFKLAFFKPGGADPFGGGADAAATLTALATEATWQSALDAADPDKLILIPRVSEQEAYDETAGNITPMDGAGRTVHIRNNDTNPLPFSMRALSPDNKKALLALSEVGALRFLPINEDGTLYCNDPALAGNTDFDPWFGAENLIYNGDIANRDQTNITRATLYIKPGTFINAVKVFGVDFLRTIEAA